jgi:hypothetical protein
MPNVVSAVVDALISGWETLEHGMFLNAVHLKARSLLSATIAHPVFMPSSPGSKKTPQDTYAEELTNPDRGYPLYIPEPYDHLPAAYKRRGIQIGDVGVIRPNGGFEYFFSIACTKDDPINKDRYGVPDGFEVYSPFFHEPGSSSASAVTPSILHSASVPHLTPSTVETAAPTVASSSARGTSDVSSDIWSGNPRISQVKDLYPKKYVIKSEHMSSSDIKFNASASPCVNFFID